MPSDPINDSVRDSIVPNGVARSVETSVDIGDGASPSESVIQAIVDATGVDALDLPPLHRTIDAEALDALVRSTSSASSVSFEYESLQIVVTGDGDISVSDLDQN